MKTFEEIKNSELQRYTILLNDNLKRLKENPDDLVSKLSVKDCNKVIDNIDEHAQALIARMANEFLNEVRNYYIAHPDQEGFSPKESVDVTRWSNLKTYFQYFFQFGEDILKAFNGKNIPDNLRNQFMEMLNSNLGLEIPSLQDLNDAKMRYENSDGVDKIEAQRDYFILRCKNGDFYDVVGSRFIADVVALYEAEMAKQSAGPKL